jgi:hypothetical protein
MTVPVMATVLDLREGIINSITAATITTPSAPIAFSHKKPMPDFQNNKMMNTSVMTAL